MKTQGKSARTINKNTPISEDEYNDLYEYSEDDDEEEEDDEIYPFEDSAGTDNQLPIIPSPINLEDSGKSAELSANLGLLIAAGMALNENKGGSHSQRQMLINKRHHNQIPLEDLLQQVE